MTILASRMYYGAKVQTRSELALLELYGDEGFKCEFSEKESWSVEPYTSSVLMCMKRETPTFLDASSKTPGSQNITNHELIS